MSVPPQARLGSYDYHDLTAWPDMVFLPTNGLCQVAGCANIGDGTMLGAPDEAIAELRRRWPDVREGFWSTFSAQYSGGSPCYHPTAEACATLKVLALDKVISDGGSHRASLYDVLAARALAYAEADVARNPGGITAQQAAVEEAHSAVNELTIEGWLR